MQEAYGLTAEDRVLQKTPFGFDVSLWEFFWPLLFGARLVFARPEGHKDAQYLVDLIARQRVTTLHFVPSMLEAFLEAPGLASLSTLRRVMASGEALPAQLVRRFFARLGDAELHNLYGPTEASVDVSFWPCVPEPPGSLVPIGRPIDNHRLHVVDRYLELQPVGVAGELLLGGPGLARGYLGRPDLTAGVFIPDPFGGAPGGRLYRTGDLARRLPDGNVDLLGRTDHQVKLRGFRIELGEIESVLARHPAVRAAAVLLRRDLPAGGGLVAYVALDGEKPPVDSLRGWLERRLPGYMVPAAFIALESLPLTANGKVDRRALPAPQADLETAALAPPRNSFEEALARIWAGLLGRARLGIESNFFELGGDSILAVRLVSRMNEELGLNFKVQDLFKHQTIAALAAQSATVAGRISVEQERAAGLQKIESLCQAILADPQQSASLPDGYEDFFPLSAIEKGMIYYSLLLPEEPVYHDQFVYLLRLAEVEVFFEALRRTMERHSVFRTGFHVYAFAEPIKVVHRELHLGVERAVEDLSALSRSGQQSRIEEYRASDVEDKFRFAGEALWRFKLFRLRDDLHCAILTFHHAMLDGWSCASFWVEVNNLYVRLHGRQSHGEALPPPASS
jgi:acyl carrier protein